MEHDSEVCRSVFSYTVAVRNVDGDRWCPCRDYKTRLEVNVQYFLSQTFFVHRIAPTRKICFRTETLELGAGVEARSIEVEEGAALGRATSIRKTLGKTVTTGAWRQRESLFLRSLFVAFVGGKRRPVNTSVSCSRVIKIIGEDRMEALLGNYLCLTLR